MHRLRHLRRGLPVVDATAAQRSELSSGIDLPGLPQSAALRDAGRWRPAVPGREPRAYWYLRASGGVPRRCQATWRWSNCPASQQLPPAFMDFVISRGIADGVLIPGCRAKRLPIRLGVAWTKERLGGKRDPYLRARVPRGVSLTIWASALETRRVAAEIVAFMKTIAVLPRPEAALTAVGVAGLHASHDLPVS